MSAYYNEIDPYAAQWLRNLIAAGHIADGVVDERSIVDVEPADLAGYTQCHFFAGLGGWSYALRLAGWDDSRPVWSGSPPCQPFSVAGLQKGKDDERHLAPHWLELVSECRPPVVFGEQVTGAIRHGWFDDLQAHLEGQGYACGMVVLPACSVGGYHIRQRQWIFAERMADTPPAGRAAWRAESGYGQAAGSGGADKLAHTDDQGSQGRQRVPECADQQSPGPGGVDGGLADAEISGSGAGLCDSEQTEQRRDVAANYRSNGRMEHPRSIGRQRRETSTLGYQHDGPASERAEGQHGAGESGAHWIYQDGTSPPDSFWRAADWLYCRDGKWRPVMPNSFPLVDGSAFKLGSGSPLAGKSRTGMLKAAGNAIVPQVAAEVIAAYMEDAS